MQIKLYIIYLFIGAIMIASCYLIFWAVTKLSIKHRLASQITSLIGICLVLFGILVIGTNFQTAYRTGATGEKFLNYSYSQFKHATKYSFNRKMPKKNQRNILVVLYRFGCPDCERVHQQIKHDFPRSNSKIYYVPSRSKYGKYLVKKSEAKIVPSVVYIDKHNHARVSNLVSNGKYLPSTAKFYLDLIKKTK